MTLYVVKPSDFAFHQVSKDWKSIRDSTVKSANNPYDFFYILIEEYVRTCIYPVKNSYSIDPFREFTCKQEVALKR